MTRLCSKLGGTPRPRPKPSAPGTLLASVWRMSSAARLTIRQAPSESPASMRSARRGSAGPDTRAP
eukprot:8541739-Alexandrium_andersonii.AAC.1